MTWSLEPLFKEFEGINPLAPGADGTIDPALFDLMFRGQMVLHKHRVQLPREFTLPMKTAVFGTRFFATFSGSTTDRHRSELRYLSFCMARAVGSFVVCNTTLMYGLVSPATGRKLALVGAHRAVDASRRAVRHLAKQTTDGARAVVSYSYNSYNSYFSYSAGLVSAAGPKTGPIAAVFVHVRCHVRDLLRRRGARVLRANDRDDAGRRWCGQCAAAGGGGSGGGLREGPVGCCGRRKERDRYVDSRRWSVGRQQSRGGDKRRAGVGVRPWCMSVSFCFQVRLRLQSASSFLIINVHVPGPQ